MNQRTSKLRKLKSDNDCAVVVYDLDGDSNVNVKQEYTGSDNEYGMGSYDDESQIDPSYETEVLTLTIEDLTTLGFDFADANADQAGGYEVSNMKEEKLTS